MAEFTDKQTPLLIPRWKCILNYLPFCHRHFLGLLCIGSDFEPPRKRQRIDDFDLVGLWMSNRANRPIPAIQDLLGFIERPLSEDEKIPITQSEFDRLLSTPAPDICDASDIWSLFRIGEPLNDTRLAEITLAVKMTPFSISGF